MSLYAEDVLGRTGSWVEKLFVPEAPQSPLLLAEKPQSQPPSLLRGSWRPECQAEGLVNICKEGPFGEKVAQAE